MSLPEPRKLEMLKDSLAYPKLKKGKIVTIPEKVADQLIQDNEAKLYTGYNGADLILGEDSLNKKEKADKKDEPKKTSLLITDECIYEQIKKPSGCAFLCYTFADGTIKEHPFISGDEPLYPIVDEEVVNNHILLPSSIEEYETEEKLVESIESHVKKYLDVPEDYLHYAALNVLKSWVYERFNSLNYLRVQGEPGTGKSRFLDVIGGLHYKPIATSGAASPAAVFRIINKWHPTLLIDEADRKSSDETDDMTKIINQGFEKGRPVLRCNPDDKSKVEFFDVYCPKVLGTRRVFDDIATESRCMTQIMTGTSRSDIIASLNDNFRAEQAVLRNKLLLWRFRNYRRIDPDIGETLDWNGIEPRLKQVNIGFVSLIANDKPYIQKFMDKVRDKQTEIRNERSETTEGHIIAACSKLLIEDKPFVAKAIIDYADLTDKHGNKWKPRSIASYMKTLGFLGTKVYRIEDKTEKVYEYDKGTLLVLFRKYLTQDEFEMFDSEVRAKAGSIKSRFHGSYFVYHVTVVTIVYGQGKNGNIDPFKPNVTNKGSYSYDGNIGNTVTNKLTQLLTSGDLVEIKPGLYQKNI